MNQQGPRKLCQVEFAFYDEAKKAIVINGLIEEQQVQIPWYESQLKFRPDMDKVYEMKKTAELLCGKKIWVEFTGENKS